MTRRTIWVAVTAWVAVVAVASGVTWLTISSAGQQVLTTEPLPPLAPAASPTGLPSSAADTVTPAPRRTREAPSASTPPPPSPRSTSAPDPTAPSAPTPSGSPAGEDPGPAARDATWQGDAGVVRARCAGEDVSLQTATPADGYGVEIESRGPDRVELVFRGSDREVELRAECEGGAVAFRTDADRDD